MKQTDFPMNPFVLAIQTVFGIKVALKEILKQREMF
jgi:hypothetical protein